MLIQIIVPGLYSNFDRTGHHLTVGAKDYVKDEISTFPGWYGDFLIANGYGKKAEAQEIVEVEEKELEIKVKQESVIDITEGAIKAAETLGIPVEDLRGKTGTGKEGRIVARDVINWYQEE
jgi:hypothetical protein